MPISNPNSEPSNLNSPILWIDFRSGNVAMLLGNGETWQGTLPISSADRSQINTPAAVVAMEKTGSALQPEPEG